MTEKHYKKGASLPPLKPGVLRIYSMRFCPYADRTRLVLAHKNISFETVNINLSDKPDWFLTKNPLGTVPALEIDDKIVYESTAASEWLDDVYPQNRLQPTDPFRKAWDRIHLEYFGKVTTAFYGFVFKTEEKEKYTGDLTKHIQYYENVLAQRGGPFFGDSNPAMLDFFVLPHLWRSNILLKRDGINVLTDSANYPKLTQWYQAMLQLPAVKKALVEEKELVHFLDSYMAGKPDHDYGIED